MRYNQESSKLSFIDKIEVSFCSLLKCFKMSSFQDLRRILLLFGVIFLGISLGIVVNGYDTSELSIKEIIDTPVFKTLFVIFIIFLIVFTGLIIFKFKYRISYWEIILAIFLISFFSTLFFTLETSKEEYLLSQPWEVIILTPILIILLGLFTGTLSNAHWPKEKNYDKNIFIEDNPLNYDNDYNDEEDKIDQDSTYNYLISKIEYALFKDVYKSSFSIGVIGPWGTGKSSFLAAAKHAVCKATIKELKDDYAINIDKKPDTIFIEFSPFLNHNEEQVIHEFFTQLSNKLSERSGQLSNLITVYSEKLANIAEKNSWLSLFKIARNSRQNLSAQELYTDIKDCIKDLNTKIIVTIDDLDRLNSREILQVLKLIRNTSNFPNMVFLVALDKEYVMKALQEENDYMKEHYLDKFFQYEVHVTVELHDKLINYTSELLKRSLKRKVEDEEYLKKIIHTFQILKDVHYFISNYRDVLRFVNQFMIDFTITNVSFTALEIENKDLFRLTTLKIFAPSLLKDLKMNKITEIGQKDSSDFNVLYLNTDADFKKDSEEFSLSNLSYFGLSIEDNTVTISGRTYSENIGLVFLELFAVEYDFLGIIHNENRIKLTEVKYKDNLKWYFSHNRALQHSYSIEELFNVKNNQLKLKLKELLSDNIEIDESELSQELKNLISKVLEYEGNSSAYEVQRKVEIVLTIINNFGINHYFIHKFEEILQRYYENYKSDAEQWFYKAINEGHISEKILFNFLLTTNFAKKIDLKTIFKSDVINKFLYFLRNNDISFRYENLKSFSKYYSSFHEIKDMCRSMLLSKLKDEKDVISFAKCFIIQRSFNSSFLVDSFFKELFEDILEVTRLFERIGQGESEEIKTVIEFLVLSETYNLGERGDLYLNLDFLDTNSMGKPKTTHFYYQIYLLLKKKEIIELFRNQNITQVINEFDYSNIIDTLENEGNVLYHFILADENIHLYDKLFNEFRNFNTQSGVINVYDSSKAGPAFIMNNETYADCISYQKIYFTKPFNKEEEDTPEKLTFNIKLKEKITHPELVMLSNDVLQNRLKRTNDFKSKRVFMFYDLENKFNQDLSWATSHYDDNKFDYNIQGLQLFQENNLIEKYYRKSSEIIYWIDNNAPGSLLKLNNDELLVTYFSDGSKLEEKVICEREVNLMKYRFIKEKVKEEYFTVDENNQLLYYSEESPFLKLNEFKK